MNKSQNILLGKLLLSSGKRGRMWSGMVAMCVGISLLFGAVLLWQNFDRLLNGSASEDDLGSTFLTVSKRVTSASMGRPESTFFTPREVEALSKAPQVTDAGLVRSVAPRAYMSMQFGPGAGFSTVMILESVPDRFLDKMPGNWDWQPGSRQVPVIISSSFLSLYNYAFAPSQGLPQLSEESIKALPFKLSISSESGDINYVAQVAGFSDRISSVLVPESFVQYANGNMTLPAARLVLKVKDPSDDAFAAYLKSHDYQTNLELMRWNRLRAVVQTIVFVLAIVAVFLLGLSLLLFSLFVELTVARSLASIQLLRQLGYSRGMLRQFLVRKFTPPLVVVVVIALLLAGIAQVAAHYWAAGQNLSLPMLPGWMLWVCLVLVSAFLFLRIRRAVRVSLR